MKKVLILFLVLGMVSCKKSNSKTHKEEQDWVIEVHYLDDGIDTLYITTPVDECGCDEVAPWIDTSNGVSVLKLDWKTRASYVKRYRVISNNKIKLN